MFYDKFKISVKELKRLSQQYFNPSGRGVQGENKLQPNKQWRVGQPAEL